jgi:hypothetical protein
VRRDGRTQARASGTDDEDVVGMSLDVGVTLDHD